MTYVPRPDDVAGIRLASRMPHKNCAVIAAHERLGLFAEDAGDRVGKWRDETSTCSMGRIRRAIGETRDGAKVKQSLQITDDATEAVLSSSGSIQR